jgi:hypothetical protein
VTVDRQGFATVAVDHLHIHQPANGLCVWGGQQAECGHQGEAVR